MTLLEDYRDDLGSAAFDATYGAAEAVTYTPAGGDPFALSAILSRADMDRLLDTNIFADQVEALVRHSDLVAGGVTDPAASLEGESADTIIIDDENGNPTVWYVRGKSIDPRTKIWTLRLEAAIRIVPR